MTIENNPSGFGYIASCDHCSYIEDFEEAESFVEAVAAIKQDGWVISKPKDEWNHECPSCKQKRLAEVQK